MRRSPILPGFLLALLSAVAWSQDTSSYYSMLQGSDGTIYGIDVSNYDNGGPPDSYAGGTSLGSHALAQGIASITIPAGTLAEGEYQLTAYYAGDKTNPAVTSPAITLTVQ